MRAKGMERDAEDREPRGWIRSTAERSTYCSDSANPVLPPIHAVWFTLESMELRCLSRVACTRLLFDPRAPSDCCFSVMSLMPMSVVAVLCVVIPARHSAAVSPDPSRSCGRRLVICFAVPLLVRLLELGRCVHMRWTPSRFKGRCGRCLSCAGGGGC